MDFPTESISGLLKELQVMFYDWPMGTLIVVLIAIAVLILLGLIIWGLFTALDSWCLPRHRSRVKVTRKSFTAAHIQLLMIGTISHPVHHPASWSIRVLVGDEEGRIGVSKETYDLLSQGDPVTAEYVNGRISGRLYLKGIWVP